MKAECIAAYIQERAGTEDEWQLQKLTYYADAWSLAWTGRPLVSEAFEAWKYGPVCRELWNRRQGIKRNGAEPLRRSEISGVQAGIVDAILDYYGGLSPRALMEKTHEEDLWKKARGDLANDQPGFEVIDRGEVMRFYATEALKGRAPAVPQQVSSTKVHSDQSERIDNLARKWSAVLERLADL